MNKIGIAKWLSMSPVEQAQFLKKTDEEKARRLSSLTDEKAFRQTLELLNFMDSLAPMPHIPPSCGLGRIL